MIQVRRTTYRGEAGFLVCGNDGRHVFPVKVFTPHEQQARRIADAIRKGEEWSFDSTSA
jgi:hypothetical protein